MTLVSKTFELYGKTYTFESGELAKQATGACLVKQGDTTMLDTVVVSKERKNYDFFPLTVDFNEKMYAAGRIPGGYLKREGRPSEKATLTARMIDRPIRPSFPDGFRNEVHIVATSLVADQVNPFDVINVMGASLAMTLGGVPFEGPLACVRIGRNVETGEFIVNPTYEERENSDLDLELGGSADFISMVEAGAEEISEDDMLAAMKFGQEALAAFCQAQDEFVAEWEQVNGAIVKKEYPLDQPVEEVQERIFAHYDEMAAALRDADKLSRIGKVEALKESIRAEFTEEEQAAWEREIPVALKKLEKKAMRTMVVETGERVDGRAADEIRPIMVKDNYLPLVHGSGLFQRGQTQVLSVLSLGMLNEGQRLDTIEPTEGKRYMHHYNFPPFCTGETGRMGSPKRREIGHGNLAERALIPVLPDQAEFPYTIRCVSETFESNGSTSQASVCASSMSLMAAGVPMRRSRLGAKISLKPRSKMLAKIGSIIVVPTASRTRWRSLRPMKLEMTALEPMETPTKRLMRRLIRKVLAPTAANASLVAKRPTTATSMVTKSCCMMPLAAKGSAKRRILPSKGPWVISTVFLSAIVANFGTKVQRNF